MLELISLFAILALFGAAAGLVEWYCYLSDKKKQLSRMDRPRWIPQAEHAATSGGDHTLVRLKIVVEKPRLDSTFGG